MYHGNAAVVGPASANRVRDMDTPLTGIRESMIIALIVGEMVTQILMVVKVNMEMESAHTVIDGGSENIQYDDSAW